MDFDFSQEQKMIREMVRKFVEREVKPKIEEYERAEMFPMPLVKKAAKLGLLGIIIPEKYGGGGSRHYFLLHNGGRNSQDLGWPWAYHVR